jgi:hypothetical protein
MAGLEAALAGVLIGLAPYHLEPGDLARETRLRLLAHEMAGLRPAVSAGLIMVGQSESGFAAYVAAGCLEPPRGAPRCDADKQGQPQALGYWQLHRSVCPAAWAFPPWTLESLREQIACAARLWERAAWRCLPRGGGFGCGWVKRSWSQARYSSILARLPVERQ